MRFIILIFAVVVVGCDGGKPSASQSENQFRVSELPGELQLNQFDVESFENVGTEESPVWLSRFFADVSTRYETYEISNVIDGTRIVEKVYSAGESFEIDGRVRAQPIGDSDWEYEFQVNTAPIRDMGRRLDDYGRDAVHIDSDEAQALIAEENERRRQEEIAREQRLAEQRAERERREEEEKARRQAIEDAVAEHDARFAPETSMGDMTSSACPEPGTEYVLLVEGVDNDGSVWGSGPYQWYSDFSTAVIHSGVLEIGQTGVVRLETVRQNEYRGSPRNGVKSENYSTNFPCHRTVGYTVELLEVIE